uniref:Uncharacterized protein n=1 Tax=Sinocyclocheilus rhinocerous TaxID=307959 RepID=A0A673KMT1_9TELE
MTKYAFVLAVPVVQRKLGDVRLNELSVWLGARTPVSPREIYIDVRRGGIGGISMLLTGYCKERWRKYH